MDINQHGPEASRALNESSLLAEWLPEERLVFAARAQAEATLALAYEQRTANMIAAFGQLIDGDTETFLGERINGYNLAQEIADRITVANPQPGEVVVPSPVLPTKAIGSKDSYYLLTAARNIRQGYGVGGSGVTNMVIKLLTDTAAALEAEGK